MLYFKECNYSKGFLPTIFLASALRSYVCKRSLISSNHYCSVCTVYERNVRQGTYILNCTHTLYTHP